MTARTPGGSTTAAPLRATAARPCNCARRCGTPWRRPSPAPHSGRLRATVTAPDRGRAAERLHAAAGRLRTEVAGSINRRKAPELVFAVV